MTKKEFLESFPNLLKDETIEKVAEPTKITEVVYVKTLQNHKAKLFSESLNANNEYMLFKGMEFQKVVESATNEEFKKLESEGFIKKCIEKSRVAKELMKRNYEVKIKIELIPIYAQTEFTTIPVHWNVFAIFEIENVECLAIKWKGSYYQKVFIFVEDGVLINRLPPVPISDDTPTGFTGCVFDEKEVILSY